MNMNASKLMSPERKLVMWKNVKKLLTCGHRKPPVSETGHPAHEGAYSFGQTYPSAGRCPSDVVAEGSSWKIFSMRCHFWVEDMEGSQPWKRAT